MGNKSQVDILKELVKEQNDYIKQLEQKISFQDTIIQQYQADSDTKKTELEKLIEECSARLNETTCLRDSYRQMVSEITQIKSEYNDNLANLISSVRSNK